MIVTNRTGDDAGRLLLLEGGIVLEPALEFMTLRAEKIEGNHLSSPEQKFNILRFLWQVNN